uniref:Uncharacterized protein n=1 Tax=Quercus lobata TaxID=97700 RepID=A0A7N2LI65_QUELO
MLPESVNRIAGGYLDYVCLLLCLRTQVVELLANQRQSRREEWGKDAEDPEQAKLRAGLDSVIIREKPNVKWSDMAGLESAKQALQEAVILPVKFA